MLPFTQLFQCCGAARQSCRSLPSRNLKGLESPLCGRSGHSESVLTTWRSALFGNQLPLQLPSVGGVIGMMTSETLPGMVFECSRPLKRFQFVALSLFRKA